MSGLKVTRGDTLELPLSAVTEVISFLATRGAGKSFAGADFAEEFYAASLQFVVVDPMGVYWGLRSSLNGTKAGLGVVVLGGERGDVPLEPTSGRLIADVVVDTGQSFVLDLSLFDSKSDQVKFMEAFCERIFYRKGPIEARTPMMIIVDEADEFAPQKPAPDETRMLGHMIRLAKRGRTRGIGLMPLTQRSAEFNKGILDLSSAVVFMRTAGPRDREAIKKWLAGSAPELLNLVEALFPKLETGHALIYSPHWLRLDEPVEVQFRMIRTFDSYKTPEPGEARPAPAKTAPIDLAVLGEQIAATVERAKESDPKELRKRISELERQLAAKPSADDGQIERLQAHIAELEAREPERIEVAVFPEALKTTIRQDYDGIAAHLDSIDESLARSRARLDEELETLLPAAAAPAKPDTSGHVRTLSAVHDTRRRELPASAPRRELPRVPVDRSNGDVKIGKGERVVLSILAQYPDGRTLAELAFLAGYSAKASTIGVIISNLRKAGYLEDGNKPVRPTAAGLEAAGGAIERPTGPALLDQWLQHPRMGKGEREVLLALLDLDPEEPTNDELCSITGYSPTASTIGVILSNLRKLGLVQKGARRLAPEFVDALREGVAA